MYFPTKQSPSRTDIKENMMANQISSDDQKNRLKEVFKALAPTYDALAFLQDTARRLIELANISEGARVLDVATGIVAMNCARVVGSTGKVVGIDLSADMLAVARQKSAAAGLSNIEFREGDAEKLDFPDASFDAVLCASSLFFIPDMQSALKEARRVLAQNGCVEFNSFQSAFLQPGRDLWSARLQKHGVKIGSLPTDRIPDTATCEKLLRDAGFTQIDVRVEQLGYYLPTIEERWHDIAVGLEGMPLLRLPEEQREQIKAEHFAELKELVTDNGFWVDVPAIFAFGR
jgi:ubiquinone/menaquinone biosynthesis C-methylase UbiE